MLSNEDREEDTYRYRPDFSVDPPRDFSLYPDGTSESEIIESCPKRCRQVTYASPEKENGLNESQLRGRQKQIDYGRNTEGYRLYLRQIPK